MSEAFKTVLILSILGTLLILPLLAIKPITSKKFSARWQYFIWIAVMFFMLIPVYKIIPAKEVKVHYNSQPNTHVIPIVPYESTLNQPSEPSQLPITSDKPNDFPDPSAIPSKNKNAIVLNIPECVAYIWFFGVCIGLAVATVSYVSYLTKKKKRSVTVTGNPTFEQTKNELSIKRSIRIRITDNHCSPMLVGLFFPVIYIPRGEISDENLRMMFLHELTHYKRKDLFFKWLSLFVNVLHWFNPFAYLLCANLSEACEMSCDMTVTQKMSDSEQKTYMKTILDLVE